MSVRFNAPQEFIAQRFAAHARLPLDHRLLVDHLAGFGVEFLARLQRIRATCRLSP